jgi:hypothetical protein
MLIAELLIEFLISTDRRLRIEQRSALAEISCFVECNMRACG